MKLNTLLYTDPSGEFLIGLAIAVAVAVTLNGINNMIHGIPFWYGMGKSGFMGAVSGAISFGIGSVAVSEFTSIYSQATFQAGMHGVTGGIMSELQGGTFASGFAAGAISSIVSSGIEGLGRSGGYSDSNCNWSTLASRNPDLFKATMIVAGGLSGGISSSIAGGNFWAGVRQGLITSGLNHLGHSVANGIESRSLYNSIKKNWHVNPDDEAKIESSQLNDFGEAVLKNSMDITNNPAFRLVDSIKSENYSETGVQAYGQTMRMSSDNGKTYSVTGVIEISRIALSSWVTLASTMGHELNHYYHITSGAYNRWIKKYNNEDYAWARSEYIAQYWESKVGGIPIQSIMINNYNIMKSYEHMVK